MTRNKITRVSGYTFQRTDQVFADANVWLSVYGQAVWARRRAGDYSAALRSIRESGCRLFIDVLVLSEFINAYARIEFQRLQPNVEFKAFRRSPAFGPVAKAIESDAVRILRNCTRVGSGFEGVNITTLLAMFAQGASDFNDQIIAELCLTRGFKLITDDADFAASGLDILTANPKLLSSTA